MKRASKVINRTLGASCTYEHRNGDITPDINVIIDKNKKVTDDFGSLIAYRVEASFLKEDIPEPRNQDLIHDSEGLQWELTERTEETSAKWYYTVVRR